MSQLVIRPWTLSPPPLGMVLSVPRLPFPYLLKQVCVEVQSASGTTGIVILNLTDGASGIIGRWCSESFDGTSLGAVVTFAPGLNRSSGAGAALPSYGIVGKWFPTESPGRTICQGAIPDDFWMMPSMKLEAYASTQFGSFQMLAASLIIAFEPPASMLRR